MEKKRLFRILGKADPLVVKELAEEITKTHQLTIIKEPGKTLAMIKLREPVRQSLFYLGEVIVSEAVVELGGVGGVGVTMGDNTEKALHMAIIDGAINKGVFTQMDRLIGLEQGQICLEQRENAMHLKTMVSFDSMDKEVAKDGGAWQKA